MAASKSSNTSYAAVGMPYFFISPFAKILLPSICAAAFDGPKTGMPMCSRASAMPRQRGSSGVTTAKSAFTSRARSTAPSISVAPTGTQTASAAMPPLPGRA